MDKREPLKRLRAHRAALTYQQYATIRGQIIAGDIEGAEKGLRKLLSRKE